MMQVQATSEQLPLSSQSAVQSFLDAVRRELDSGRLVPYLGPGIFGDRSPVPASYRALAEFFGARVALPRRARGKLWASAQYVESHKHRTTVEALMTEAFSESLTPLPLHRRLAERELPLVVDTWYDGGMRAALGESSSWVEVQGGSRAAIGEDRFFHTYAPGGGSLDQASARDATTVLYKPHGSVAPARNYLVSDADYVEVLTEIDIQTPIPPIVQARRTIRGFLYLGCSFADQTLRIFARQIGKRSEGPHFAVVDPAWGLSPNEQRFLRERGAQVVVTPLQPLLAQL